MLSTVTFPGFFIFSEQHWNKIPPTANCPVNTGLRTIRNETLLPQQVPVTF